MKTEDLIDALAAGLEPAKPARPSPALLGAAAAAAVAAVALLLGVRPDLAQALQGPIPWLKGITPPPWREPGSGWRHGSGDPASIRARPPSPCSPSWLWRCFGA